MGPPLAKKQLHFGGMGGFHGGGDAAPAPSGGGGALEEDLLLLVVLLFQHLVKPLKCMCTGAPLTVDFTHSHCLGKTPSCFFGATL
jgi:hypothetical protein